MSAGEDELEDMRPVTSGLSDEHRKIEIELAAAEAAATALDFGRLRRTLAYFATHVALHRRKEEEVLFPALSRVPPLASGPVQVMLHEHDQERQLLATLAGILEAPDQGRRPEDAQRARALVFDLSALLEGHIAKEDQVLYRIAEDVLAGEAGASIRRALDAIGYIPAQAE